MAKGILKFETDKCKGCELCVAACPKKVLEIKEDRVNIKGYMPVGQKEGGECIGCAICATMCPDGVISVYVED